MPTPSGGFVLLDWIVLVGYFVGVTLFGVWLARRVRSSGSYFLGDRKLPWWIMVGQSFGTGTHAEQPVAQTGASFDAGFATIWYQWKNMLITPFYWLISPWYRRSEKTTIGEMIEDRYGPALALLYTFFAIAFLVFNQGAMLKGAGKLIAVATGGELVSANHVVILMTVAFILYSFFSGMIAAAYTNFIQGLLIIVMSFLLIPAGLNQIGGFSGLHESLPDHYFELYSEASGIGLFAIIMLTINGLVGIAAQPHILSMNATGNTERAGRVGSTYGAVVKRFCTIGWAFTGLIVAAMVLKQGTTLDDPEAAFGYASLHLLGPGLTGLMVACVMAANMSTCSNFMVNTGALFAHNLYLPCVRNATDQQLLWVGRLSGLMLTGLGVLFAIYVDRVLQAFLFTETIAALMGIMFMGGILWKRANRQGAWVATILAFVSYYALNYLMSCSLNGQTADSLHESIGWLRQSWANGTLGSYLASGETKLVYQWMAGPFACAMLIGTVGLVVGSLLTRREDAARTDRFFDDMRRSTDHETLPEGHPKPLAADEGKDLILLDLAGWLTAERWRGFFRRYREDFVGFTLAWGMVFGLVGMAWLLMQIGRVNLG